MLKRCSPRYAPAVVCASRGREKEHPGKPQNPPENPPGSPMGKYQSDRMQVIGGKLLIGQLAPWVTWESDTDVRCFVARSARPEKLEA